MQGFCSPTYGTKEANFLHVRFCNRNSDAVFMNVKANEFFPDDIEVSFRLRIERHNTQAAPAAGQVIVIRSF